MPYRLVEYLGIIGYETANLIVLVRMGEKYMKRLVLRKLFVGVVVFTIGITLLVLGLVVGGQYSLRAEMRMHEKLLIQNLLILSDCKKKYYKCSEELQAIMMRGNAIALDTLVTLEQHNTNLFSRVIWPIWTVIYLIYSSPEDIKSSEQLKEYYKNIGCGIDGQFC